MASIPVVLLAALGAILYLSFAGLGLARWLRPAWAPAASIAPALAWGVFSAVSFPLQALFGFSQISTAALLALALAGSLVLLRRGRSQRNGADQIGPQLPVWAFALAAVIALIPLAALLPKHADGGVILATASSDHSKIAMIDEMTRLGAAGRQPLLRRVRGALFAVLLLSLALRRGAAVDPDPHLGVGGRRGDDRRDPPTPPSC